MTRQHQIPSADGTRLAVFDHGPQDAAPILLVHGWSQHHLSWARQMPLAERFRLILPDLRGHGASDKPDAAEAYNNSTPWAADIKAITDALDLDHPALVGWSMGGSVLLDYLRIHGGDAVSGLMIVGAGVTLGRFSPIEAQEARAKDPAVMSEAMYGTDQEANLNATMAFLRACFHQQPDPDDFARMTGFNMLVPPHIRHAARRRNEDYRPVAAAFDKPVALLAGRHERLCLPSMQTEAVAAFPNARHLVYDTSGHSPFWEEPDQFNADLASFVEGL